MDDEQDIDLEAIAVQLASELAARREQRMSDMFAEVRETQRRVERSKTNKRGNDNEQASSKT